MTLCRTDFPPSLDVSRPVVTRNGSRATIIATGLRAHKPVVAVIHGEDGDEVESFYADGRYSFAPTLGGLDLVNLPTVRRVA